MTWPQASFLVCGFLFAPLTGFIIAWCRHRDGGAPIRSFLIGVLAVLASLTVSGFVARGLFPEYPLRFVSEPVAISFTTAALFMAIGIALWAGSRSSARFRRTVVATVALSYLVSLGLARQITWPMRRHLPWSATIVEESVWADGLLPDYDYSLTARMHESHFLPYVARLGLAEHAYDELKWVGLPDEATGSDIYAHEWSQGGTYAAFANGRVYVHSFRM